MDTCNEGIEGTDNVREHVYTGDEDDQVLRSVLVDAVDHLKLMVTYTNS